MKGLSDHHSRCAHIADRCRQPCASRLWTTKKLLSPVLPGPGHYRIPRWPEPLNLKLTLKLRCGGAAPLHAGNVPTIEAQALRILPKRNPPDIHQQITTASSKPHKAYLWTRGTYFLRTYHWTVIMRNPPQNKVLSGPDRSMRCEDALQF